jgi:thiol:disulfide interchange protein DsbC
MKVLHYSFIVSLLFPAVTIASEASVKQAMQKKYPNVEIQSVVRTPIAGIYEVYAGNEILYVDEKVNYLIAQGRMIDVTRNTNLTEERLGILTAIKFDQLPLDLAFQMVRGNGKRKMAYFTDPNCPYCKHLDQELAKLTDVTIYLFLYPILSQNSQDKSRAVWCSKDRVKTWNDMMLNDIAPPATGACNTPIEKILAFGRQKNIRGTPTLFFANGQRVSGAISSDQLNKLLDSAR